MSTKPTPAHQVTEAAAAATESIIARTLLTPLLFISFIFSLFWIDRKTSSEVLQHDHDHSPDKRRRKSSVPAREREEYYHSHQRHLAKQEFDEAFAIRGRVIAAMCIGSAVGLVGLAWCGMKMWELLEVWSGKTRV